MVKRWFNLCALAPAAAGCFFAQAQAHIQTFSLLDPSGLVAPKSTIVAANYLDRKCVRVTVDKEDGESLVVLPGTDFQDGTIEAEIALKPTAPPGRRFPGFVGIAFRVRPDASHYELFYLRPGNSQAPDQAMRNHSVQYVSEPDFGWYPLRRQWPWVYEAHAELAMETWMRLRIEVSGRSAKLYLNGSSNPSLVVDGLKGEDLHGAVGLWGYSKEEAYFSNVRITSVPPQDLKNDAEAAGKWQMHYASDAATFDATMELHRDGSKLTGTWSGPLGENCAVTGTLRNGYVELSFPAEWPKEAGIGTPGPVQAFLAGWIDLDSAKGRMRVEGRSDGIWTAKRTE
jgi:hypothetical protein